MNGEQGLTTDFMQLDLKMFKRSEKSTGVTHGEEYEFILISMRNSQVTTESKLLYLSQNDLVLNFQLS